MDRINKIENINNVIILPQTIIMKWHSKYINYYVALGYKYTKVGDEFNVNVLDLPQGSPKKIKCKCKYCNDIIEKPVKYISINHDNICCYKCKGKKMVNTNQQRYGVNSTGELEWVKEKAKQTNLQRYGTEYAFQNNNIKQKIINTNMKRIGVPYPMMSKDILNKSKQTCLNKYGVEHAMQSEEVKNKFNNTMIKRYSVTNIMFIEEIKNKVIIKGNQTMYQNGTGVCTKPQKHIYELLNKLSPCELNYPISRIKLDIAYPYDNIYIEYNGGGHNLSVIKGDLTQKEFDAKEIKRKKYLENRGWKIIRIECKNDKLLSDDKIVELINEGKNYLLNSVHTWFDIDLNTMKIICSEYQKDITK